ncbi:MAG: serine/threonine-protein kinase, partial [Carbonactinosporaceae bacterium]
MGDHAEQRLVADRYALDGVLGRGGMGVVWRARDRLIGRLVAVKELPLPPAMATHRRDALRERVLREARAAGRINHPAAVTVHDVVAEDGMLYIVMELVDAPTLDELLASHGPLPPQRAAAIGLQVLGALEAAHADGIVHRDVKPANILTLADGRAKLGDFGIAQVRDDPRITESGVMVGSPAFMAPEQVSGRPAGPPADLWSLGVTLYVAVEGCSPFERQHHAATLHALTHDAPAAPSCGEPLAGAILRLLDMSPS